MLTVWTLDKVKVVLEINKGKIKKTTKTLLITHTCVVLARVLKVFFHVKAGVIRNLILNFEQK